MIWECYATVTFADDGLIRLNKFVSRFYGRKLQLVFLLETENPFRHPTKHPMWHHLNFFGATKHSLV